MNQTKDQKVRRLAFKVSEMGINYESPSAIPGEIFYSELLLSLSLIFCLYKICFQR